MGIKYLWDTNTAIYYLQQQFPHQAEKWLDRQLKDWMPCISAITEIELLCWKSASQNDLELLRNFISDARVIELEQTIKLKNAEIRLSHKVKLPDAIFAATAVVYKLTLISRNVDDFKSIKGLKFLNIWDK